MLVIKVGKNGRVMEPVFTLQWPEYLLSQELAAALSLRRLLAFALKSDS
jgi:hypothetical protein